MRPGKRVTAFAIRGGIVASLAFALLSNAGTAAPQPADALQDWIAKSSVSIRSINAADADFSDLEPMGQAIGSARVVQLGEPSHGAGTGFEAKARLVRFLHERLGFDVLVWESGLYDVRLTEAGLRAGEDPRKAAQRGIFSIWSAAAEVQPLLDYVKASQATMRPVEMAGFDLQFTSDECFDHFAADLHVAANMRNEGLDLYDVMGPDRPAGSAAFAPRFEVENRRDAVNANNLRWLIQEVYAGGSTSTRWQHRRENSSPRTAVCFPRPALTEASRATSYAFHAADTLAKIRHQHAQRPDRSC